MTPYYQDDACTIYHGDCREILPVLTCRPRLVLTDPPYGIGYEAMRDGTQPIANDANLIVARLLLRSVLSSLREAEAHFVFCDWRSLPMVVEEMRDAGIRPKTSLVWDKGRGVQNLDRFAKSHELAIYAGPYGGEKTQGLDVWRVARDFEPDHPTPKPVGLFLRAISATTDTGDLVVDPFMGTGPTLRAAKDLGRKAIGIEVDERYCEIAARRLAQEVLAL